MSFPIVFPPNSGPGRLVEICTFRKSELPNEEFEARFDETMKFTRDFPISRKAFLGVVQEDPGCAFLLIDWTSAEEKDIFEPGERYQSLKPGFAKLIDASNPAFACHHVILGGPLTTPSFKSITVSRFEISADKQDEAAAVLERTISADGNADKFLNAAPSREKSDVVVCFTGSTEVGEVAKNKHGEIQTMLSGFGKVETTYNVTIRRIWEF